MNSFLRKINFCLIDFKLYIYLSNNFYIKFNEDVIEMYTEGDILVNHQILDEINI